MEVGGTQNDLLMKLLSVASLRSRVIASNISGQNIPGFKRQVVRFEEMLEAELQSSSPDFSSIEPRIETDYLSPDGGNGNNVSMEVERGAMVENRLLYEAYAQILQTRMDMMRLSIAESR